MANQPAKSQTDPQPESKSAIAGIKEGNALTRKNETLPANGLHVGLVGQTTRLFTCEVNPRVTVKDVLNDGFFSHVASQLRPFDAIEIRWQDRSRVVTVRVHSAGNTWAKTHLASEVEMGSSISGQVPEGYEIDFVQTGWRVIRTDTKAVMKDGFDLDREALAWLTTHLL